MTDATLAPHDELEPASDAPAPEVVLQAANDNSPIEELPATGTETAILAALAIVVAAGLYAAFELGQIYYAARRRETLRRGSSHG